MSPPAAAVTAPRRTAAGRSRQPVRAKAATRSVGAGRAKASAARNGVVASSVRIHRASARPAGLVPLPAAVGRTAGAALRLPDWSLIHRLTRGRWWIGLLGLLLAGIVAVNVVTLSLSSGSGKRSERIENLQSSNSELAARLARRTAADALQKRAATIGMITPEPGDIRYLTARGDRDVRAAVRRLEAPTPATHPTAPAAGPLTPVTGAAPQVPAVAPATALPTQATPTVPPAVAATPTPAPPVAPAGGAIAAP